MKLGQIYSQLYYAGEWTITGGICPYVGAGGHLTGGGEGMLTRQYGLGIDQVSFQSSWNSIINNHSLINKQVNCRGYRIG